MNSHQPHFPVPAEKLKYHACSAVILNDKDEVLLFLRDDMPLWTNIGGNVDPGETFEQALHREALEEADCKITIDRFVGDFFSPQLDGNYYHEKLYVCHLNSGQTPRWQEDEGVKLEWFPKNSLPVNMGPRYRFRMLQAFKDDKDPVAIITPQLNMVEFLHDTTDFSNFIGLQEWLTHPIVERKRRMGQLRFDPLPLLNDLV